MTNRRLPLISVLGSSQCGLEIAQLAERTGELLVEAGFGIVCGGGGGVMEAVCQGAARLDGVTIGILPGDKSTSANPSVRFSIPTGLGEARNAIVVRAGAMVLAIGGGYGTLSEIALALKWGKTVIGLKTWQAQDGRGNLAEIEICSNPEEAVARIVALTDTFNVEGG
jgi:uncharacterized protein (TIGR00725 family)